MKPLIVINEELDFGITPSVDLDDVLFWEAGANVIFRRKSVSPMLPHNQGFAKAEATPIRGMFECIIDGQINIFFGSQTRLYRWTAAAGLVGVTRSTGYYTGLVDSTLELHPVFANMRKSFATVWSFTQWGRWVVATNGRDVPQLYIPEAGSFRDLDTENENNMTFKTAEIMLSFKNFMFALNTAPAVESGNGGETFVHFSELDDLEKWDPTSVLNKYAGDLPIRDADGPIRAALVTDNALVFTTNHALHAIEFVGAPEFFGSEKHVTGCGTFSKQCFLVMGRIFYGMGSQGIWKSDGVQVEYVDEPYMHKYIYEDLNFLQAEKCFLWNNVFEEMLEFHYPSLNSTEIDKAVGYNYRDNNWTIIERVRTSGTRNAVLTHGVTATTNGDIAFQMTGGALAEGGDRSGFDNKPFMFAETESSIVVGFGDGGFGLGGFGGYTYVS